MFVFVKTETKKEGGIMGQYYMPYIKSLKDNQERSVNAHKFGSGLKITEHSWIGNNMCSQVYNWILNNPSIVAWVGDYAEFEMINNKHSITKKVWDKIRSAIWGSDKNKYQQKPESELFYFDFYKNRYLVNESKKQFLDIEEFRKRCFIVDWGCLSPLSLLTAIGNGQGGGDYFGRNEDKIGIWAFDTIQITDQKPDYEEIKIDFIEKFLDKEGE